MTFATCDLCDANEDQLADGSLAVLPPVFRQFGRLIAFSGPAVTLKVFEDNTLVRTALEQPGDGRVLVVDGGGSLRCALLGGNLAQLAEQNGWAGVIIDGCVRDSLEINGCNIGVRALATHPKKSAKQGAGALHTRVTIAGVAVEPGYWMYADADGVLAAVCKLD
ncbi:ribonuclease E activity regulator RraA [Undibacterium arcticum]|uniref:4-hydroxy-4-methyl-2-oxoglutarate aldolase n=1 Tax=Undibacterium arcticum TaxID=1762892 RepID=A0ABV7F7X7_9BURK